MFGADKKKSLLSDSPHTKRCFQTEQSKGLKSDDGKTEKSDTTSVFARLEVTSTSLVERERRGYGSATRGLDGQNNELDG
jgi:hypothetical protein